MWYGVTWYPEQKNDREFEHDLKLLKESGINVVRMADFAWSSLEPEEGKYDFGWLDKAILRLGEAGISSIICTPTASMPAWLAEKYPGILYVDNRGFTRPYGARRQYCYNNDVYREYSRKIAAKLGDRYGKNPNVLGFQIDNELGQEGTGRCHCKICEKKFQNWLEQRYRTIAELNQKMGMVFWGHLYNHFGQIKLPVQNIEPGAQEYILNYFDNPSLRLDFERFASESNIEYQNLQLTELRKHTNKIITTNATGTGTNSIDYYKSYGQLDMYATDLYPDLRSEHISSFECAFSRGVKIENLNFWVLEFSAGGGHGLWAKEGRLQPFPGALKQAVLHTFASGAEMVCHFQFRTYPYGAEQLNYAVLDLDGVPRRRFYELKETAAELKQLGKIFEDGEIKNEVAIIYDYDSLWALKIKPIKHEFDYKGYINEIYSNLHSKGIGADIVSFDAQLDKYKLVIVPSAFVMKPATAGKLKSFVACGGTLVATFVTGVKTTYNTGVTTGLPGELTDLFGAVVTEVEPVFPQTTTCVEIKLDGEVYSGTNQYWTEVLEPNEADIIGEYADSFRCGNAVAVKNNCGKGEAYYLGSAFDKELTGIILDRIATKAGISRIPFKIPENFEVIKRYYQGKVLYCIFNMNNCAVSLEIDREYYGVQDGRLYSGNIEMAARQSLFLMGKITK